MRIRLERVDAKRLPYADGQFAAVMSNSIVHHMPQPREVLAEAVRVVRAGGLIFIRDLARPRDDEQVRELVRTYAGQASDHQRQLFDDSLRAALSVEEMCALVVELGYAADTVNATSDRHWTWVATSDVGSALVALPPVAREGGCTQPLRSSACGLWRARGGGAC